MICAIAVGARFRVPTRRRRDSATRRCIPGLDTHLKKIGTAAARSRQVGWERRGGAIQRRPVAEWARSRERVGKHIPEMNTDLRIGTDVRRELAPHFPRSHVLAFQQYGNVGRGSDF